jgi:hypothetical protein
MAEGVAFSNRDYRQLRPYPLEKPVGNSSATAVMRDDDRLDRRQVVLLESLGFGVAREQDIAVSPAQDSDDGPGVHLVTPRRTGTKGPGGIAIHHRQGLPRSIEVDLESADLQDHAGVSEHLAGAALGESGPKIQICTGLLGAAGRGHRSGSRRFGQFCPVE